jgi:hypothetical protein
MKQERKSLFKVHRTLATEIHVQVFQDLSLLFVPKCNAPRRKCIAPKAMLSYINNNPSRLFIFTFASPRHDLFPQKFVYFQHLYSKPHITQKKRVSDATYVHPQP